jgi:hypothetical protein
MRSVPSAAWRQARVFDAVDEGGQRTESEKQDEEDGEGAPHLDIMLADAERRRSVMTRK